jgi:hypothetical protein
VIDEIRIMNAPGGVAVQQIEQGVVVKEKVYPSKAVAEEAAHKVGVKESAPVEDWTEADV